VGGFGLRSNKVREEIKRLARRQNPPAIPDYVNAIATRLEHSRTSPAMVTARKLLEANSSRMGHLVSLGNVGRRFGYRAPLLEQTTAALHSQRNFPPDAISTAVDALTQHLCEAER
jgi:hypothetical protein